MLPFGVTAVEFAVVTFLSAFIGILVVILASGFVRVRYLAAFALGVYLWYFTDTLGGANYLDVDGGFAYSSYLASLVLLFVVGLLVFFSLDRKLFDQAGKAAYGALAIGALAALAMGLHGMAEGVDFGITAAQTPSNSLLDAFGGLAPAASWVLHKMLEPTVAGVAFVTIAGTGTGRPLGKVVDALVVAVVFTAPAVVGSVVGYYNPFDSSYVYALGLGTSVYALARIGRPLYSEDPGSWLSTKMAVAVMVGFVLIFMSAMLHS